MKKRTCRRNAQVGLQRKGLSTEKCDRSVCSNQLEGLIPEGRGFTFLTSAINVGQIKTRQETSALRLPSTARIQGITDAERTDTIQNLGSIITLFYTQNVLIRCRLDTGTIHLLCIYGDLY